MSSAPPPDTEAFKQVTDAALRAVAGKREIEVTYTPTETLNKKLALTSKERARLPVPPLKMSARDKSVLRGAADAEGLRLKHHNPTIHLKTAPQDERAKAVHDALEMARIEALGAREMAGIRDNLNIAGLIEGAEVWITDISGRTVYRVTSTSTAITVPVGNLSGGIYTLSVVTDGRSEVTRFIKQ